MVKRLAPKCGYDIGAKRQYRRDVWSYFAKHCPVPRSEANCLLMPSIDGDEIDVALSKGFKEERLHIVDMNPAIVATLKRRFTKINTYGIRLADVWKRGRIKAGTIHAANLDLCSNISAEWAMAVMETGWNLACNGLLAATFLRGRDPVVARAIRAVGDGEPGGGRDRIALALAGMSFQKRAESVYRRYKTGVSPMGFVVGRCGFNDARLYTSVTNLAACNLDDPLEWLYASFCKVYMVLEETHGFVTPSHENWAYRIAMHFGDRDLLHQQWSIHAAMVMLSIVLQSAREQNQENKSIAGWSLPRLGVVCVMPTRGGIAWDPLGEAAEFARIRRTLSERHRLINVEREELAITASESFAELLSETERRGLILGADCRAIRKQFRRLVRRLKIA